jgi:hypothetical protein
LRGWNVASPFLNFYRDSGHGKILRIGDIQNGIVINRAEKQLPVAKKIFRFFLIRIKTRSGALLPRTARAPAALLCSSMVQGGGKRRMGMMMAPFALCAESNAQPS